MEQNGWSIFVERVAHEHEYVLQDLPDRPRDRAGSTGE